MRYVDRRRVLDDLIAAEPDGVVGIVVGSRTLKVAPPSVEKAILQLEETKITPLPLAPLGRGRIAAAPDAAAADPHRIVRVERDGGRISDRRGLGLGAVGRRLAKCLCFFAYSSTTFRTQFVFNSIGPMLQAALDGFGVAYLVEGQVQPYLDRGELVRVLADCCPPFPGYHLYYPSRRQPTPAFTLVIEALRYRA